MAVSIRLTAVTSLAPFIEDGALVAFNVGPDRVVYLVVALEPLDYRIEQPGGASLAKSLPDHPQRYRVVGLYDDRVVLDVHIDKERFNIHDVQPLPGEILLACSRANFKGPDDFERNGRVYTLEGRFARDILLGDGIESVQTTSGGTIWTSYFDEGVFGNHGWPTPVGASGLVEWSQNGAKLYEFQPGEVDSICDCYALNVESERDVWLCYYTDFPLVHLRDHKIRAVWEMPLKGSNAFAVANGHALFRGGYDHRDTFELFALPDGRPPKSLAKFKLINEHGIPLVVNRSVGRADTLYLLSNDVLYQLDVQTALAKSVKA